MATYLSNTTAWSVGAQKGDLLFKKPDLSTNSTCAFWTNAFWLSTDDKRTYCDQNAACFWNNDTNVCRTVPNQDLIWLMLADFGQQRVHTGLVASSTSVVHNTRAFDTSSVNSVAYTRYGGGSIDPGDFFVDPHWLQHGTIGDGVQTADLSGWSGAANTTVFTTWNAASVNPPWYSPYSRTWAQATTDYLQGHPHEYNIGAYTNLDTTPGAMCSGSVLRASQSQPFGFTEVAYADTTRLNMAWALYSDLTWYLANKVGTPAGAAMGVARQIVNCFAFNQCGDSCSWTGSSWAGWMPSCSTSWNIFNPLQCSVSARFDGICDRNANDFSSGWTLTTSDPHYINRACPGGVCRSASPDDLVSQINARQTNYEPVERSANIEGGGYFNVVQYSCTATCGDGVCAGTETPSTCANDCPGFCGDGICTPAEQGTGCSDCGAPHCGRCTPAIARSCVLDGLTCVCGECQ